MKLDGLKEGWTNPFDCCVTVQEGRSKRRYYHLGEGMDFTGVTAITGGEPPAYAWASWIATEAGRLFALHNAGMDDVKFESVWDGNHLEWVASPVSPGERLVDGYLEGHGTRMSQRAADRGTVTELLLTDWQKFGYIAEEDVEDWLKHKLYEFRPDGKAWQCHFDEVYPYCLGLRAFLEEHNVEIKATSVLVLHDKLKYATVVDLWAVIDGTLYSLNLKTSSATRRDHAEQVSAEFYATHYVPTGAVEAVPYEKVRKAMVPGILIVDGGKATLRKLNDPSYWFESFKAAHARWERNLAPMPFDTVKASKAEAQAVTA